MDGLEAKKTTKTTEVVKPKSVEKNMNGEPITAVTPQGANMIDTYTGSNLGFGPWTNPKNAKGQDDFSRDPDNRSDANAKVHDEMPMAISIKSLKNDAKFVINQVDVAMSSVENALLPIANQNSVMKINPNQDIYTKAPVSPTTGTKALFTATVIGGVAALKVVAAPFVAAGNAIENTYNRAVSTYNNVASKTSQGLSDINNWRP